jgi:hypothetical protein
MGIPVVIGSQVSWVQVRCLFLAHRDIPHTHATVSWVSYGYNTEPHFFLCFIDFYKAQGQALFLAKPCDCLSRLAPASSLCHIMTQANHVYLFPPSSLYNSKTNISIAFLGIAIQQYKWKTRTGKYKIHIKVLIMFL